jgi:(p)ppGpp synthase/HD superfamily hydrolase
MDLTPKIKKANDFAAEKHKGQLRKGSDIPYFTHPEAVAKILSEYTDDEEVISAGYLHDVLEDVEGVEFEDLSRNFNRKIAEIVQDVTGEKEPNSKKEKQATWKYRKTQYIQHLQEASTQALLVCAADKIHNLESIIEKYKQEGESMWNIFSTPEPKKENVIWYYSKVLKTLKELFNHEILLRFESTLQQLKNILN